MPLSLSLSYLMAVASQFPNLLDTTVTPWSSISAVFTSVFTWIVTAIQSIIPIFWDSTDGLTFFGILAIISLGFSIFFLFMGLVQNFLHFRG